jgi:hypothetical protein
VLRQSSSNIASSRILPLDDIHKSSHHLLLNTRTSNLTITHTNMSDKLSHPDPAKVMVIRDVVPKVITTLSVPFWRFGKIKIGGRGTIGTDPLQHIK